MPNFEPTEDITAAQDAADVFGNEHFPGYHSMTEDGLYSLFTTVTREFDVAELMTGLGIPVPYEFEFVPSPFVAASTDADYRAAHMIAETVPDFWEGASQKIAESPLYAPIVAQFGPEATQRGWCILSDSSCMSDLLADYVALETADAADAHAKISEYMRLLAAADTAYRAAGWEL
jgi:hypothetical protein